ncbi:MAG: acyltransferase, partial [Pseudomonadota bacterium]
EIAGYIGANLAFANFLVPTLPGLFEGQRFEAVNGALWTLKIEVMFYLSLVLLGPICARLAGRRGGLLIFFCAIYVASELWRFGFENLAAREGDLFYAQLARQLPGQMAFFVCGIGLWVWKHKVQRHLPWIGGAGAVLCLASVFWPWAEFFRPLGLAGLVAWMAWTRGPRLPVTRFGDLSYGIYIVHFPIIQALIGLSLFEAHPAIGVVAAIGLTLAASLALWVFVERPALAPSSLYRQTRGD